MGEVIEFHILSANVMFYKQVLVFLENFFHDRYRLQEIGAMDNWKYENRIELKSLSDIDRYVETKIVCIELMIKDVAAGVSIEKKSDDYYIDSWINPQKEITEEKYREIISSFISRFRKSKEIKICGAGREVLVDFDMLKDYDSKRGIKISPFGLFTK